VIEHTDEKYPHLHFYVVPDAEERFEDVHEGRRAALEVKARGGLKGPQNAAYKAAMRVWQDDFSKQVASNFGLTRLGPKLRRLPRAGWKAEQKQAKSLANTRIKHSVVEISPADLKRKVIKQNLIKTEYESDSVFANRITEIVKEKIGPVTSIAAKSGFFYELSQRVQTSLDELKKESETTNQHLKEAKSILSLFSDEQIAAAKAAKNERDRKDFEHAKQLIEKQKKQEQLKAISVERQRRIEAIPRLLNSAVGAARTFIEHALEALKKVSDPGQIKWGIVEGSAAAESMSMHGQEPEHVARAICDLSPARVDPLRHAEVHEWCAKKGPEFAEQYELRRTGAVRDYD